MSREIRRGVAALVAVWGLAGCGGGGGGGGGGGSGPELPPDTTPDPFAFAERTNVARGAGVSATATISGINFASTIAVTGGEYSIAGGSYTSAAGTVTNGATVGIRVTASTTPG